MAGLHRRSDRLYQQMYATAARLGDPQTVAYVTWSDGLTRNAVRLDEVEAREILRRVLTEHGRWLDAQEYLWAAGGLCTSLTFCGYPQESLAWYERARAQVASHEQARSHTFSVAGAAGWAMLGRSEDTAAQLRAARDVLADQPDNRDAWMTYIVAALMAAVEQSQLGEEFESVVAEMERIRPSPRRAWQTWRFMWVYLAQGRLAQCMAASEQERPARLAAARKAIRELRRAASMPIIRAHYLILQAAYRQLTGDHQRRAAAAGAGREDRPAAGRADPGLRDRPRARPGAAVPR